MIPPNELEQKSNPDISDILVLSFEYLLAGVSAEYSRIKGISSFEDFNEKNSFNFTTLLSYPFFIALSNGHSESLYKLFGEFKAFNFGPISMSLYDELRGKSAAPPPRKLSYFSLGLTGEPGGFKTTAKGRDFKEVQELICKKDVTYNNKTEPFENILIKSESGRSNPLVIAISSGIAAIKKQSRDTFFNGDTYSILFQANYFDVFKKASNSGTPKKIEYTQIEKPERRPFYTKELVY